MQSCLNCGAKNKDTAKFCNACGHRMAHSLAPGEILQGRYKITRLLGQGGMGAVYQAQDQRLGGHPVAVKENFDTSIEAQNQFKVEATTLAHLTHPSLPRVSDHFIETSGKQYLVMDYVEGEDLQEMLDRLGPLAESHVLPWFDQVCDALSYMHTQRPAIIHRDIKPSNIKITPAGKAMLVDFGIAKQYRSGQKTVAAARAVTSGFSPPEQYGGASTDARSDVYALGATLYCLLTGKTPPDAMDRLANDRLIPPKRFVPSLSSDTARALLNAMQLQPASRPSTIEVLRGQLKTRSAAAYQAAPVVSHYGMPAVSSVQAPVYPAPIVTPSPVSTWTMVEFATFWRRMAAYTIDGIILSFIFLAIVLLSVVVAAALGGSDDTLAMLQCLGYGISAIITFAYYVQFYTRSGQTPGKRAVGIQVVSADGSDITKKQARTRTIVYMIELALIYFLVGLLGFLWMTWDANKQTWHDKAAKTYVVKL